MNTKEYITPTKENPIFIASCDHFGNIAGPYKDWRIEGVCCGDTFAVTFAGAINDLHEWLKENRDLLDEFPKSKFEIYVVDGTVKGGEFVDKKVYSISASKAKKYLI